MAGKAESPPQKSSKKNEQLNEAFVLTFQEQVETAILEKQTTLPQVRLFCQDESRLGLLLWFKEESPHAGVKPVALVDSHITIRMPNPNRMQQVEKAKWISDCSKLKAYS